VLTFTWRRKHYRLPKRISTWKTIRWTKFKERVLLNCVINYRQSSANYRKFLLFYRNALRCTALWTSDVLLAVGKWLVPLSLREDNQLLGIRSYQHCSLKAHFLDRLITITSSRNSPMIPDWCSTITSCSESRIVTALHVGRSGVRISKEARFFFFFRKRPNRLGCPVNCYSVGTRVVIYSNPNKCTE